MLVQPSITANAVVVYKELNELLLQFEAVVMERYICTICCFETTNSHHYYHHVVHFHRHHSRFRIICPFCHRVYTKVNSLQKHLMRIHRVTRQEQSQEEFQDESLNAATYSSIEVSSEHAAAFTHSNFVQDCAKFFLELKAKHNINDTSVNSIAVSWQHFIERVTNNHRQQILESNLSQLSKEAVLKIITLNSDTTAFLSKMSTSNYRKQYYQKFFDFFEPKAMVLGSHWKTVSKPKRKKHGVPVMTKRIRKVDDKFYYISLIQTLGVLLKNPEILAELDEEKLPTIRLQDISDGNVVKGHPILKQQTALKLLAYYDDIEIANPLGSKASKHKLGCFYWTLLNINQKHRSAAHMVQVFAITKTQHIKRYGVDAILQPFVEELKVLSKDDGFEFVTYYGKRKLKGALVAFVGDTPAVNLVGGFKEGVGGASKMCRSCYCTKTDGRNEIVSKLSHQECQLRNLEKHLEHCKIIDNNAINATTASYWSMYWGINRLSVLNEAPFFNICRCLPHDVMHVLFEGAVSFEIKLFLLHCVDNLKLFTMDWFSEQLAQFPLYGCENVDRPSKIEKRMLNTRGHKINQTAAQTINLCHILPFIVGNCVPEDDAKWKCMRMALQIACFALAFSVTPEEVAVFASLIKEHHVTFLNEYGEKNATPKFHYMVHLPHQILEFGPLRHHWCMRFEGKHQFFKKAMVNRSFKNAPFSMAYHHQYYASYMIFNESGQASNYLNGGVQNVKGLHQVDMTDELKPLLAAYGFSENTVFCASEVKVDGITWDKRDFLCLESGQLDNYPVFAKLKQICLVGNMVVFVLQSVTTISFCPNVLSYQVTVNEEVTTKQLDKNSFYIPLHPYEKDKKVFLRMRCSTCVEFF